MRAPRFWHRDRAGLESALIYPLSWAWSAGAQIKHGLARPLKASVPVISIGNLVAGGAGKTPCAIAIAQRLLQLGHRPHFISRGYGGRTRGPLLVETQSHDAAQVGDEALLLARVAPTWIARRRADAAAPATAAGADILVLDDAHQHATLHKDFSFLVIDGEYGIGNGRIMPAGPLRESVAKGLARTDRVILVNPRPMQSEPSLGISLRLEPLIARIVPHHLDTSFRDRRVVAFCGIARPEKFFTTLTALGANIVARYEFPDHHPFEPEEVMAMVEEANRLNAIAVTTEKDHVRLLPEARAMVEALPVSAQFEREDELDRLLHGIMEPVHGT